MRTLTGKVAVVTGAARGIGRSCVEHLAAAGADVVAVDRAPSDETVAAVRRFGVRALAATVDVTSVEQVAAVAEQVRVEFGGCHILVNNAGIHPDPPVPFLQLSYDAWRHTFDVNVDSMFHLSRAFAPHMIEHGWGRIVNLSSASVWLAVPGGSHYASSKAAVVGLTRALATEFAAHGITVNAVAPSMVRTAGLLSFVDDDLLTTVANTQTIRSVMTPDDVADVVTFLASDDSRLMTAQVLHVDGGTVRVG